MENDDKKVNESNSKFDIESNDVITNIDIAKNDIDKNSTNTIDAEEKDKSKKTKKEKKPKKPKTIKQIIISRIIFVIIFLAIVVGITYYFINLQSNNVNQENNIAEETTSIEQKSSYTTVDLNGSYYTNPIKISIKTESMDRVPDGFEYYEIDGLKNETIEKKINAYIKDNFKNYLKNLMDKTEENITYSVSLSVVGNFANIISLEMYISEDVNPDEYDFNYYCHFCNLNLIDGEEIDLGKDVFESKTVASNFLLETLYEPMVQMHTEMDEETYELYPSKDSAYIEEEIYEMVSNYQRGNGFEFGIAPSAVVCAIEEKYTYIQYLYFLNYAKKLIIYDRFSSKKELYDGKYEKVRTFL